MNRNRVTAAAAAFAISTVFAMPVLAQEGHQGNGQRSGGRPHAEGQARPDNRPTEQRAVPRASVPQRVAPPQSISPGFSAPRAQAVPRNDPRVERRVESPRFAQPRVIPSQPRFEQHFDQRRFDERRFDQRRFDQRRFDDRRYVGPRVIRPGIVVTRPYYRPYYTFRPRLSLGFGLWVGYPVLYSSYGPYYAPYPYTYSDAYPATTYPVPAPGTVVPGSVAPVASGGLSFDITPPDAEVYVDGEYVGTVDQYAPNEQPLTLTPGRHRVEVNAPGYQSLSFDTDVLAGQVIPYQGAMLPR